MCAIRFLQPLFLILVTLLPYRLPAQTADRSAWIETHEVRVPVADGLLIHGRIYYPRTQAAAPTIILLNPWSMGGWIYGLRAMDWARKGFVVLTYNLRGWVGSEGEADVGGPRDMDDVSRILDWLEANHRVDSQAIGIGGVSLGAGVSLLAAAHDSRIRAVAAMSGWSDLYSPIYGYNTQRTYWDRLLQIGAVVGTGSDAASQTKQIKAAVKSGDVTPIREYADIRSPRLFTDRLIAHQPAIFISHNYSDILFPVSDMWNFFRDLQLPKKLKLQAGVHASVEALGFFSAEPNPLWDEAGAWFERWLKSPRPFSPENTQEYHINLVDKVVRVTEVNELVPAPARFPLAVSHTIRFGRTSGINSGLPIVYPLLNSCKIFQPVLDMSRIDHDQAAIYELGRATGEVDLIGIPRLSLLMTVLHGTSAQVIAHLFQVNDRNQWHLISMTPYTLRGVHPGETRSVEFELYGSFAHVKKNDRLILAIDTFDPEFSKAPGADFKVTLEAGDESWIDLPLTKPEALR